MALPMRVDDSAPPYGTLIFDCDSTLSRIEGIDELAGPRKSEIEALTKRAMAGEIALQDVYGQRLEMLRPTRAAIDALGAKYVETALPHARELVAGMHALGKRVAIVSGGIRHAVCVLASALGVAEHDVFAVDVFHHRDGSYAGFDDESPLARSGGKLEVVRQLAKEDRRGGVALIGDGATDLEGAPAARRFIAFGGVVTRPAVFERAVVSCDKPDLAALLPLLVATDELEALAHASAHSTLIQASRVLRG